MFAFNVGSVLGKFWLRNRTHRSQARKRHTRTLGVESLETRALLAHLLGTAIDFAVLGGQTVTNTGPTALVGSLGVYPGSAITGFPPGIVTGGSIHAADAVALQAQSDVTAAYIALAGQPFDSDLTGVDLGGLTLTAGVYHFSSSAQLTGTLTLDAEGNPDAEFIFQIGSTLTTASNSSVVIINGGDPCEVYWQVGSSATLGTFTVFTGHILALTSIALQTGTSVNGSALARNGEVTLDDNIVSNADCVNGSISGLKFNDLNGDGTQQVGEPGLAGWTIFIDTNLNGIFDAGELSTTTDASGNYTFLDLPPGTYRVLEVQQTGFTQTSANPADVVVDVGADISGVLFGNFALVTLSGLKFQDMDGDGILDPGEPGLAGVTIFLDANLNGVFDAGELSTITDVNGNYSFANLPPGTYRVLEVLQTGFTQTTVNPADIVVSSGTDISGVLFGNFALVTLSGLKFQDTDGDGILDPGEPGLAGVTIFLDANLNGVFDAGELSTITDINGNYSFANLPPGTYRVREVGQLNFVQMTNNPADIVITASGTIVTGILIGNIPVANLAVVGKLLFTGQNLINYLNGTFARQANFVANLYQTMLGRSPDLAGLIYYLRLLQAGFSEQQVTALFTLSGAVNTNLLIPTDVNLDGVVSPIDALLVVNFLNIGAQSDPNASGEGATDSWKRDVNLDRQISPIDALLVINQLNRQTAGSRGAGAEGETDIAPALSPAALVAFGQISGTQSAPNREDDAATEAASLYAASVDRVFDQTDWTRASVTRSEGGPYTKLAAEPDNTFTAIVGGRGRRIRKS